MARDSPKINWCLTEYANTQITNADGSFTLCEDLNIAPEEVRYLVAQKELCPTTGRVHWQIFIQLLKKERFSTVRRFLTDGHIEPAASPLRAAQYCKKVCKHAFERGTCSIPACHEGGRIPGTEVVEYGEFTSAGTRTDVIALREAVKSGKSLKYVLDDDHLVHIYARYPRVYAAMQHVYRVPSAYTPRKVRVRLGPTSCGKSRLAYDTISLEDLWMSSVGAQKLWFDHYEGQKVALFEDFVGAGSHVSLTDLLRITDVYPFRGDSKHGSVWFDPKEVWFTTNIPPSKWYDFTERRSQYDALLRRITHLDIWDFNTKLFLGSFTDMEDIARHLPFEPRSYGARSSFLRSE